MNWLNEWHQIAGVLGTVAYLGSYFMIQIGAIRVRSYRYCLINIAAACLVGVSLLYNFNLASALIQISWILISLVGITKLNRRGCRKKRTGRQHRWVIYPRH